MRQGPGDLGVGDQSPLLGVPECVRIVDRDPLGLVDSADRRGHRRGHPTVTAKRAPARFEDVRAPSTLGSLLRAFTFGHVRQPNALAARFLVRLAGHAPLLPGAGQVCFIDIYDTIKTTFGYQKQGTGYGYCGVKGLNALLAAVSTPTAAPVIAATRLRRGSVNSAKGAARLVADALATARRCGVSGAQGSRLVVVRSDSGYECICTNTRASSEGAPGA